MAQAAPDLKRVVLELGGKNDAAYGVRTGEADDVDSRVRGHLDTGVEFAGDDIDNAGRESCLLDEVADRQDFKRRVGRGLKYDRAATRPVRVPAS